MLFVASGAAMTVSALSLIPGVRTALRSATPLTRRFSFPRSLFLLHRSPPPPLAFGHAESSRRPGSPARRPPPPSPRRPPVDGEEERETGGALRATAADRVCSYRTSFPYHTAKDKDDWNLPRHARPPPRLALDARDSFCPEHVRQLAMERGRGRTESRRPILLAPVQPHSRTLTTQPEGLLLCRRHGAVMARRKPSALIRRGEEARLRMHQDSSAKGSVLSARGGGRCPVRRPGDGERTRDPLYF